MIAVFEAIASNNIIPKLSCPKDGAHSISDERRYFALTLSFTNPGLIISILLMLRLFNLLPNIINLIGKSNVYFRKVFIRISSPFLGSFLPIKIIFNLLSFILLITLALLKKSKSIPLGMIS